jgi:phage-related minor tail protein
MATSGDLQLALLIKANAQQARAELAATKAELQGVEASARQAGAGFGAYNVSLNDITAAQRAAAAAAGETTDALAGTSQAFTAATAATAATGETAEQAAARIHAMVQASLAARDAATARQAAEATAATAARGTVDAAAAQSTAWRDLAAAQTASMQAGTRAFLAREEGLAILQKSKLTTADVARAEQLLGEAVAGGAMSNRLMIDTLAQVDASKVKDAIVEEAATKATEANTKANIENAASKKLNSRTTYSIGALIDDAASGQFSRSKREIAAIANETGLLGKVMTPTGLAIGAVVAAMATLTVAFVKGESETAAFNKAIILTGGYAGQTVGQLQVLSQTAAKVADTTQHAAAGAVAAVVQSGKFYGDTVGLVAQAALAMQQTTGQAVDRTIAEFEKLGEDPVQASLKLNDATHYLTQSVYDQITALVERGEKDQAAEVAQKAYADAQIARAHDVQENLGALETMLHSVAGAAKGMWDALLDIGRAETPESKIAKLRAALADQEKLLANAGKLSTGGSGLAGGADLGGISATIPADVIKANIARIKQQIKDALVEDMFDSTDKRTAALKQQLTDQAINAQAALSSGAGTSDLQKLRTRLNTLAEEKAKALYGVVDPDKRQQIIESFNLQVADAARQYDAAEKKLSPKGRKGPNLDALQANANVAAIQDSLRAIQSAYQTANTQLAALRKMDLINDTTYYNALRTNLDDYVADRTAALEKEKAAVLAGATTAAERIKAKQKADAIDQQISDLQQERATKRMQIDADEKASIEKTAKAWLDLQASLGLPVDVDTAKAMKKLQELYDLLKKLKDEGQSPSAAQVDSMVGAALMTGVQKSPRLRSARNIPGENTRDNPLALVDQDRQNESAAYAQQQAQLAKNYAAAQELAKGNDQKLLQLQQQYQTDSEVLADNHKTAMGKIAQAEYWGRLQVASDVLGQLAELSRSSNTKIAAIGKAAAIAQTLINTYASATAAYKSMASIPYIGPALGVAAAAAAVAAGLANVAQIRAQNTGGYATGGHITGAGTGTSDSIPAMLSHGEYVVRAAAVRAIGVPMLDHLNRAGFADGGYVSPFATAPSPADLGFKAPSMPRVNMRDFASNGGGGNAAPQINVKTVLVQNSDQLAAEILNTPTGTKLIIQHVGDNPRAIQGKWSAG